MIIVDNNHSIRESFNSKAKKLSAGLRTLGVQEDDIIAVMLKNCVEYLEIIQASKQIGSYYCPINWHFTLDETSFILKDSQAKVLFIHADILAHLKLPSEINIPVIVVGESHSTLNCKNHILYEEWCNSHAEDPIVSSSPRGHMAYTSGTTGKPKGVVRYPIDLDKVSKKHVLQEIITKTLGLKVGSRALLPAPLYHSAPSLYAQNALQLCDLFVLMSKFDPIKLLETIQNYRIEVVYLVPIMFVRLLKLEKHIRNKYDLSSIQFIASTGAPCPPEIKRQMIEWLGPVVYETYASSEAGLITLLDSKQALQKPGSAGLPIGQAAIKIYTEDGRDCETGQIGYVYVRQYAYEDFYYKNNPDARAKIDKNGLINLGDIGYLDNDGYLFICDRRSDMVISGGVNIYPAEIENQIMQFEGVADCAVIGIPDDEYGESLMAFVQPLQKQSDINPADIQTWLIGKIAKYKIPKEIRISHTLPRDDNGKIYKRFLREKFWEGKTRRV